MLLTSSTATAPATGQEKEEHETPETYTNEARELQRGPEYELRTSHIVDSK